MSDVNQETITGKRLSFEALSSKIQVTQFCEKAYFQCRVWEKKYKIRLDGDDVCGTNTPLCLEYTYSRSFPESQVVAAIPEGTRTHLTF